MHRNVRRHAGYFLAIASFGAVLGGPVFAQDVESPDAPATAATAQPPEALESAEAPAAEATQTPAPTEEAVQVTIVGSRTEAQRLQESAEAVQVVDTRKARQQTADLGEVLARTQGVVIRRDGGLGSSARFSLNGLYDDKIRFFLDGVPLDLAGYPFGIANVPVNLVERVEVYRGVVPIRFGADALGGAVNLVSDQTYETHAGMSYQAGSFSTRRITADGRYRHEPTGLVFGASTFFDLTDNNYEIDVEIPDDLGRPHPATVKRFHDGYRAYGVTVEAGIVDRSWADRLLVRGFASTYDKDLQHNVVMKIAYGEVTYGETVYGATALYDVALAEDLSLELVGNHARRTIDYLDISDWIYDWNGERIGERRIAGEIDDKPHDQTSWEDGTFGRALLEYRVAPEHIVRASVSPTFTTRTGDERIQADPTARDPLTAQRDLFTFVSGLEYELSLLQDRLSNIVFVKDYYYLANTEEPLPGGVFRKREEETHAQGVGDSLRFRFTSWLYAKASYEYATRLPRPDEVFGDGVLVHANLELEPEVSHNANVGPRIELDRTVVGELTIEVNAFLRDSDRLVVLLGNDRFFTHQNVYRARGVGIENGLSWVSPGRYVSAEGTLTWQDVRNASSEGPFGDFEGDRIPNRPYLFGSWGTTLRFAGMPEKRDTLEPFYNGRYVHGFFRGWESAGLRSSKQTVDAQVTHAVGVSWVVKRDYGTFVSTLEVDNVGDSKAFDNYGVQRPGRAFYVKLTGDI